MNRKLLITSYEGKTLTAIEEDGKIVEFTVSGEEGSILGDIYVARVQKIIKNIQAAFVTFGDGKTGYYSLEDNKNPIFTNRKSNDKICEGDSIIVQVERENIKTKPPTMTSKLSLTGKYVVLTAGNSRFSISSKILDTEWKKQCKEKFSKYCNNQYGLILRTNAFGVNLEIIEQEIKNLVASYEKICDDGIHRTCYSCLYKNSPDFINQVKGVYRDGLESIITDEAGYYEQIREFLKQEQPEDLSKLRLYQDSWPFHNCYNIENQLKRALNTHVWLKSGAYLVIEPTEALTVIDVNTGKYTGNKNHPDTSLKINLEAATEIVVQLRLRNLSGMILVDFINMDRKEDQEKLLSELEKLVRKDAVKTVVYGMTALGLVEITRKKVKKPLMEQMMISCDACHGTGKVIKGTTTTENNGGNT